MTVLTFSQGPQTIADALISWVEQGYKPKDHSADEIAKLKRLTEKWVVDYERRREARNGRG